MKTLYDVQQLLKKFDIYVYVGKRMWDIEVMALELNNLRKAGVVDTDTFIAAKLVLRHEHRIEVEKARDKHQSIGGI
ncbi:YqgQ family protein [Levilactobacillus huananensis]|uniref:YqgQ family protein n=1 Tax=Levilactobacillus huananensis TaxID=2486019 RepID=UPI000F77B00C|nr:YqgQ family protein [Levilactobacillus huananensis]